MLLRTGGREPTGKTRRCSPDVAAPLSLPSLAMSTVTQVERLVAEKVRLKAEKELQLYDYPIHHAVRFSIGHFEGMAADVLRYMLESRSDQQLVRDKAGLLPIHYATGLPVLACSIEVVKELLAVENPADRKQLLAGTPIFPIHSAISCFNDSGRETTDGQQEELVCPAHGPTLVDLSRSPHAIAGMCVRDGGRRQQRSITLVVSASSCIARLLLRSGVSLMRAG